MGLRDLFAKTAAAEDPSLLRDRERILAYFEELARVRATVHLSLDGRDAAHLAARVELVRETPPGLMLAISGSAPPGIGPGALAGVYFILDGVRLKAPLRVTQRPTVATLDFALPEQVAHAERRAAPRGRFGSREKATAMVLEGLFEGTGAAGRLLNLSGGGFAMAVERALAIKGDVKLAVKPGLFPPGTALAVVRLQNIPQTPMLEVSGIVRHAVEASEGVCVGIQFKGVGSAESVLLAQVLTRKLTSSTPQSFPMRSRRREAPEAEALTPLPCPDRVPEGISAAPAGPPTAVPEPGPSPDRRLLLKKRSTRVLLILFDDAERATLAEAFRTDGYRHLGEARNFMEALAHAKAMPPDLILIDQQIGIHSAQQFIEKLRQQAPCGETPIVMLSATGDVKATLMARAARFAHVQRKPVDFPGELGGVITKLLKMGT